MEISFEFDYRHGRAIGSSRCSTAPSLEALGARKLGKVEHVVIGRFDHRQGIEAFIAHNVPELPVTVTEGTEMDGEGNIHYGYWAHVHVIKYSGDKTELLEELEEQTKLLGL